MHLLVDLKHSLEVCFGDARLARGHQVGDVFAKELSQLRANWLLLHGGAVTNRVGMFDNHESAALVPLQRHRKRKRQQQAEQRDARIGELPGRIIAAALRGTTRPPASRRLSKSAQIHHHDLLPLRKTRHVPASTRFCPNPLESLMDQESNQLLLRIVAKARRSAKTALRGALRFTANCLAAFPTMVDPTLTLMVLVVSPAANVKVPVSAE